jgi:hypothetical protein
MNTENEKHAPVAQSVSVRYLYSREWNDIIKIRIEKLLFPLLMENKKAEQDLPGGLVPVGRDRMWEDDAGGWIWCKYCVHMCINGKMKPIETIPGIGSWKIKENDGWGKFNYDTL